MEEKLLLGEVLMIPSPLMGHVGQAVEMAKLMIQRCSKNLLITVLLMKLPIDPVGITSLDSLETDHLQDHQQKQSIRFIHLPPTNPPHDPNFNTPGGLTHLIIESHKPHVKDILLLRHSQTQSPAASRVVGLVVDMFCTTMIDVANEFGLPTYVFFTSGAAFLGLMLYFQALQDHHGQDISEFKRTGTELVAPSFANSVPSSVLPLVLVDHHCWSTRFLGYARRYREAKGIIVNTFFELESRASLELSNGDPTPQVYPVGPILNRADVGWPSGTHIMDWLDGQPDASVVYLCFGTRGTFDLDQIQEIARGLESSGFRFLWSLRQPPPRKDTVEFPGEFTDLEKVLPIGFLERTAHMGKVIGCAPQLIVMSHPAIGGFVSHCGWNSILQSLWCGVPIATWPMYAEQQLNAFQLVRELELSVEIRLDYHDSGEARMVTAEEIERGIRCLMITDSELRKKVKDMKEASKITMMNGGSSHTCLGQLMDELMLSL